MNAEIWTIIGASIAVVSFMYTYMNNKFEKLDAKFEKSEQRWIESNRRMDGVYHILLKRIKEE